MPTVNATPGHASANSNLTRAEATTYFDTRLHALSWEDSDDDDKDRAIIWATRLIDATVIFTGAKAATTQALEWPRMGMKDRGGNDILATVIPQLLKDITAEVAFTLLSSDRLAESDASVEGLTSLRAGPVTLSFKDKIEARKVVSPVVMAMFVYSWVHLEVPGPYVI